MNIIKNRASEIILISLPFALLPFLTIFVYSIINFFKGWTRESINLIIITTIFLIKDDVGIKICIILKRTKINNA
jgi:hypothetical protein